MKVLFGLEVMESRRLRSRVQDLCICLDSLLDADDCVQMSAHRILVPQVVWTYFVFVLFLVSAIVFSTLAGYVL